MNYIESRNDFLRDIHSVYSHDISNFVCSLADLPDLQRISQVSKNGGVEYSCFNTMAYKYTLLDHSFGVAIILEKFKQSRPHIIEAMFHELASPSFGKSIEYLKEYFNKEDYESPAFEDCLVSKDLLFEGVSSSEFNVTDCANFKDYVLGFADFPKLSAENLEYIFTNAYFSGLCDLHEIEAMYSKVSICKNEDIVDEFCFTDPERAFEFFKLSIEVGKINRSYEAKITRRLISDVLMLMVRREEIYFDDLYKYSDKGIINIGEECSDKRIQEGWQEVLSLDKVDLKFTPTADKSKYCVKTEEKSIYVDPLIRTKNGIFRLSKVDERVEEELDKYFSSDTDMFMQIDYEL